MRTIELVDRSIAFVSDEDYDYLSQLQWYLNDRGYACTTIYGMSIRMADVVLIRMGIVKPENMELDHRDRDKLNNQRDNFRIVTRSQNCHNSGLKSNNTSGVKGVYYENQKQKWRAVISINGSRIHLGLFDQFEDAVAAREAAERRYIK